MIKHNNFYNGSVGNFKFYGFGNTPALYFNTQQVGSKRNIFSGQAGVDPKSSIPDGYIHPVSWVMPVKNGGMSARNTSRFTLSSSADIAVGAPVEASSAAFLSSLGTMTSIVDVSANSSSALSHSATMTVLKFAFLSASSNSSLSGSANMIVASHLSSNSAAYLNGLATLTSLVNMTANSVFSIVGQGNVTSLVFMNSSPISNELTPLSLAAAVWDSPSADYNSSGTMGEKMNDAGSASNPWTEIIEEGYTAADILKFISAVSYGQTDITDNGDGTATIKFRSLNGSEDRVTAEMDGSERTSVTLNA